MKLSDIGFLVVAGFVLWNQFYVPSAPDTPVTPVERVVSSDDVLEALADCVKAGNPDNANELGRLLLRLGDYGCLSSENIDEVEAALGKLDDFRNLTEEDANKIRGLVN